MSHHQLYLKRVAPYFPPIVKRPLNLPLTGHPHEHTGRGRPFCNQGRLPRLHGSRTGKGGVSSDRPGSAGAEAAEPWEARRCVGIDRRSLPRPFPCR